MYLCFSRDTGILNFAILKVEIIKVRKTKEEIAKNITHKNQEFCKKWNILQHNNFENKRVIH